MPPENQLYSQTVSMGNLQLEEELTIEKNCDRGKFYKKTTEKGKLKR